MISIIETLFSEDEDPAASGDGEGIKKKQWDLKLNKEDIKVYVKKAGGSRFHKDHPYIKAEIIFNKAYSMSKIIKAVSPFNFYD